MKTRKSSPLVFRVTHRASDGSEPTKITSNPSIPAVCRFSNLLANLLREKERRENRIVKFFSIRCDFDEGKKKKKKLLLRAILYRRARLIDRVQR